MEFTKRGFNNFREDLKEALKALEEKHNVTISHGGIRYDDTLFTTKMTVTKNRTDGKDVQQAEFEMNCSLYGFKESDYKRKFVSLGETFQIIGFKTRARKMPVMAVSVSTGRRYKFATDRVNLI